MNKSSHNSKTRLFFVTLILSGLCIFATPHQAFAYDNDTHFWLTYYLAIKAGYTPIQATQIASANVSVDFDKDTEPVLPRLSFFDYFHPIAKHQRIRSTLHALPWKVNVLGDPNEETYYWWDPRQETQEKLDKARKEVNELKQRLEKDALEAKTGNPGVYLHYMQDSYAHDGFTGWLGHAGYYYVDFLDSDHHKAEQMALETFDFLANYRENQLGGKYAPLKVIEIKNEIKLDLLKFYVANKSEGVKPNALVENWNSFFEWEKSSHFKRPPDIYWLTFFVIRQNAPAPNSQKARAVVQEIFSYRDDEMPHIWKYDLKASGEPANSKAKKAYVYKNIQILDKTFTARDEFMNYDLLSVPKNTKQKQCLPFVLVNDMKLTIPSCK